MMNDISEDIFVLEKSVLKSLRRENRKKLEYIEPFEEPGTIYNAEVHGSAQRLLNVHRITKYVKFCRCCSLPQETPGAVVPFNFFDDQLDIGIGIYFYFYYIKFCIFISIICIGLSSISTIIFSKSYANDIRDYCHYKFDSLNNTINISKSFFNYSENCNFVSSLRKLENENVLQSCQKYLNSTYRDDSGESIKSDWLSDMSSYNLKSYYDVFKYEASKNQEDNIHNVILNYSIMYFITGLTIIIASFLFIQFFWLLAQYEDFKETTPSDFSVLIHNVPKGNSNTEINKELKRIVDEVSRYTSTPLEIQESIPCTRIIELTDIAKKKYEEETKLYHVHNFEKQKKLNKKYGYDKSKNNLHYFKNFLCINRSTPVQEIEKNIEQYKIKFNELHDDIYLNSCKYHEGTFFLVFKTMMMKDVFFDFFPSSFFMRMIWCIRYFFESTILRCCISQEKINMAKLKLSIHVKDNIEPYEVIWGNMGYSWAERNIRLFLSIFLCIVLMGICLAIMIALNYLQRHVTKKDLHFWKYVISFLISIIIAITNAIAKFALKKLTFLEKNEIITKFYISYSIKLTIFNFVTIAVLPVVSNLIFGLKNSDLLVNNLLMIFIINILLPPILFYFGPELALKLYQRTKARMELKNVKYENSVYTQGELNDYFENPEMDLYYKYAFITNIILISLFYMSIFPIGMIFGLGGLILTYLSEYFYIGYYKRPELLNSSLSRYYVSNFKWATFIFAVGNYLFLGLIHDKQTTGWNLINLIVFFAISLFPYQSIKINIMNIKESDIKNETYQDNYFYFSTDYIKLNPLTCKDGYKLYFHKLIDENIIDKQEGERIIQKINKLNEIELYLKMRRHINDYIASQQLNNLYTKNKVKAINNYFFDSMNLTQEKFIEYLLSHEKNFVKDSEEAYLNSVKLLNESLEYSYISNGICNALIFLDEKYNINNKYKNYNFNPWKGDLIYSKEFKNKKEKSISDILSVLNFKGEISDDENSFLIYDKKLLFNYENNMKEGQEFLENINKENAFKNNSIKKKIDDDSQKNLYLNNVNKNENFINSSYNNTENNILKEPSLFQNDNITKK